MTAKQVTIELTGPGRGTVEVDGHPVAGVRRMELVSDAGDGEPATLRLEVWAYRVDLQGLAEVGVEIVEPERLNERVKYQCPSCERMAEVPFTCNECGRKAST